MCLNSAFGRAVGNSGVCLGFVKYLKNENRGKLPLLYLLRSLQPQRLENNNTLFTLLKHLSILFHPKVKGGIAGVQAFGFFIGGHTPNGTVGGSGGCG